MQDAAGITRSEDEPVWSVPLPLMNRVAELGYGFCWFWEGFSLYMFPIKLFNKNKYIYLKSTKQNIILKDKVNIVSYLLNLNAKDQHISLQMRSCLWESLFVILSYRKW